MNVSKYTSGIFFKLLIAVLVLPLAATPSFAGGKNGAKPMSCFALDGAYGADGGFAWAKSHHIPICNGQYQGQVQFQAQAQYQAQMQAQYQMQYQVQFQVQGQFQAQGGFSILNEYHTGGKGFKHQICDCNYGQPKKNGGHYKNGGNANYGGHFKN